MLKQCKSCNKLSEIEKSYCLECGGYNFSQNIIIDDKFVVYDIETYPNFFSICLFHPSLGELKYYEISERINESSKLRDYFTQLMTKDCMMVGFNNLYFDYPVIHTIIYGVNDYKIIYATAMNIIKGNAETIWENDHYIKQIDLFKINHYDNKAKSTSLKALEVAMRMESVQDLPIKPGTILTNKEMDMMKSYNTHDVKATTMFLVNHCLDLISFRKELSEKYGINFINKSDSKIGSDIFIKKLSDAGISTRQYINGRSVVINTVRDRVEIKDCIPDYIHFYRPEFIRVLQKFKDTVLVGDNVKSVFKDFTATVVEQSHKFIFGAGGIHSASPGYYQSDDENIILDLDVEAYYPSIIIANGYYPEHLTERFSPIFRELVEERKRVGKKTILGKGLKISANGTFGNLGNKYSPFYDLKCLLSVTITGQLLLLMFIEKILQIPNCKLIQSNTDGFTVLIKRENLQHVKSIDIWWKNLSSLNMEYNYYSRLWLADVNNYIAEDYETGKLKLKGRYAYDLEMHKNPSALIIPKTVKAVLVDGANPEKFIKSWKNPYDFMIRAKVPKSNKLVMRWNDYCEIEQQKITRFYVSKTGGKLVNIKPQTNEIGEYKRKNKISDEFYNQVMAEIGKGVWDERIHTKNKSVYKPSEETSICSGHNVNICNDVRDFNWNNLNYDYYIEGVLKECQNYT